MDKKLHIQKKRILSDSMKMLKSTEEDPEACPPSPLSRSRSDSLPNEAPFTYRTSGSRRQSLPTSQGAVLGMDATEKLLKEGILKLQNSAKNLDSAKRTVQDILDSRRTSGVAPGDIEAVRSKLSNGNFPSPPVFKIHPPSSESPPSPPSESGGLNFMSKIGRWMKSKWEDKVSSKSAEKDVKKAVKGVEAAGEVINQMGDSLLKAEEELQARAMALRRQSADAFKLVSTGIKTVNISYPEEEEDNLSAKSGETSQRAEDDNIEEALQEYAKHPGEKNKCYEQHVTNL